MQRAFIAKNVTSSFTFKVDKENSSFIVLVPQDAKIMEKEGKLYANDVVIDFRYSKVN